MAINDLRKGFDAPEVEYSACPFWFWNGDMDPDEIVRQINLMQEKGVRAFIIHARFGLKVEYLSEEWFDRCRVAVEHASSLGMKVWIYDEDNWPSGYAGGRVLKRDPDFIGWNLAMERHYVQGPTSFRVQLTNPSEIRSVSAVRIDSVQEIAGHTADQGDWANRSKFTHKYSHEPPHPLSPEYGAIAWDAPDGMWCVMVARQQTTQWNPAYSSDYYTDLLNASATRAFIEETHAQYYARFKEHFGKTILGFFTDEPGFYNNLWDRNPGSIPWTHDFPEEFERRRGYSILSRLPALWEDLGGESEQLRFDFWLTVVELLDERFASMIAGWCSDHGVMLTGHYDCEEQLAGSARCTGNPFKALQPFQVPGLDRIDEIRGKITEKLVASIAHCTGRSRVLSETYGTLGWKLAPPLMKSILDYQYVRGINWLVPHAFYFSIEGDLRWECPPSEFFQNPWWDHSRPLWDYVSCLSSVLSQGRHVAPVALYYPIDQAWTTMTALAPGPTAGAPTDRSLIPPDGIPVERTDESLIALNTRLLERQLDFDLVDYTVLESARVENGELVVGLERFIAVVVPPVDVTTSGALGQLLRVAESGGTVVFVGGLPSRVVTGSLPDGWASLRERLAAMTLPGFIGVGSGRIGFAPSGPDVAVRLLGEAVSPDVEVEIIDTNGALGSLDYLRAEREENARRAVKYHRRRIGDADVYFIINESDMPFVARLRLVGSGAAERWMPHTGERIPMPSTEDAPGRTLLTLEFSPWESHLIVLTPADGRYSQVTPRVRQVETLTGWNITVSGHEWNGDLISWHELGLPEYSGIGVYRTVYVRPEIGGAERLWLHLGEVRETAGLSVNGERVTCMAWGPYRADITDYLHEGENFISVEVANSNANEFDPLHRNRRSGLLGPVNVEIVDVETRIMDSGERNAPGII